MIFFKKSFWKNLWLTISKDWQAKLICLGIAVALWWFVYTQTNIQRSFYVPIQYLNLPPQLVILQTNDTTARIYIQGKKDKVTELETHQIRVYMDLSEANPGWYTNDLQLSLKDIDPSLAITMEKTRASVYVDAIQVVSLPIVPRITNSLPVGVGKEIIEFRPASAIVRGPTYFLSNLSHIETEPFILESFEGDYTTNVALLLPKGIELLDGSNNTITIYVRKSSPEER
ncbi:CdaR family protein [Thermospira aquatica]|uniref:YbbR-like domain-containing protein n=1 Tax=Thermospira aquatica TaxID=2828656 RepID=A0AAX3BFI7_9SPIR|nr:CdaR family protein [Thermospira aquatica]URA11122.1 hypothetical protein KDW03_04825 [Thermospira aquatica]